MFLRIEARPHQFGQIVETRFLIGDSRETLVGVGILSLNPLQWVMIKQIIDIGMRHLPRGAMVEIMDGTERKPKNVN